MFMLDEIHLRFMAPDDNYKTDEALDEAADVLEELSDVLVSAARNWLTDKLPDVEVQR